MATTTGRPARVGIITDQTGALSFMGVANLNVAKMVIGEINAQGGLLGHPIELFIEDSATDDGAAAAAATRLVFIPWDLHIGPPSLAQHRPPGTGRGRHCAHQPKPRPGTSTSTDSMKPAEMPL